MSRALRQALSRGSDDDALSLFRRAPSVRFAAATADGRVVLRTLSAVVLDGRLCFHGADDGDKLGLVGLSAVASCEEIVAQVPSYFIHPELACPASTYYLSAFAEGPIVRVEERARKAAILSALMARFQPEGGYAPITAEDPRYAKVLDSLLVAELIPTRLSAKHKLGQHRSAAQIERVMEGLWKRGAPGDMQAIRLIGEAHPARPLPAFLRGPVESRLCVAPDERDAEEVAQMLEGQYWTTGLTTGRLSRAQRGSSAWVVARDVEGRVLASARAISDEARFGYVLDVIVRPALRGRGLASALLRLLLAHPAVRGLCGVRLRTRDAQRLYEKLGFEAASFPGEEMSLRF